MNKATVLASCLFITIQLQAQQKPLTASNADTIIIPYNTGDFFHKQNMPNAYKAAPSAKAVLQGNNGQGFDLYILPTDKMPCLVPDKNNTASIPNSITAERLNADKLISLIEQLQNNNQNKQPNLLLTPRKKSKLLFPLPDLK